MIPSRVGRDVVALALSVLTLVALGACAGGRREARAPGAAVWLSGRAAPLDLPVLDRLHTGGVADFFVEAAGLEWTGAGVELQRHELPRLPRRERVTLVVSGERPPAGVDTQAAAKQLAAALDGLRLAAEGAGLLPTGIHFDSAAGARLATTATLMAELRDALDGRLHLSASVGRGDLDDPELPKLAEEVDFLVAFLYGQRPGEPEDARNWDLQEVEKGVARLEQLGRHYYLVAASAGSASLRDRRDSTRGISTSLELGALVRDGRLELKRGFSLEGIDRQVYEFRAKAPLAVGDWQLAPGDSVRVVRAATSNLEEFLRRCGAWGTERMLGPLFFRLPEPGERLVLSAANLAAALDPEPSRPRIDLEVEALESRPGSRTVRLRLVSHNDESTDLAFFEANYVEVSVTGARIADAEPGDFARFELSRDGERSTMQALRQADTVRLWVPWVDGRQELRSGPIEIVPSGREEPGIFSSGRFALTDGTILTLERRAWSGEEAP